MTVTETITHVPMLIDGVDISADERITVINPKNGEPVATIPRGDVSHVDAAVAAARLSYESGVWANATAAHRIEVIRRLAQLVGDHLDELVDLETLGNGATVRQATGFHIGYVAPHMEYFTDLATRFDSEVPGPRTSFPSLGQASVRREPIGVVAVIAPFNFPLLLASWKIVPALLTGNSVVVKPDERTSLAILRFAQLALEAGLPDGVLNVVTGTGEEVGVPLASHPDVGKVGFTGSTAVGKQIMRLAADTVKSVTLELGGKSPALVLPDADLDLAADGLLYGGLLYSGQVCESMTRLLVHESIHDEFVDRLVKRASTIVVGQPDDWDTDLGPVISQESRDRILDYINGAVADGATVAFGGKVPEGEEFSQGFWVEPTILTDVRPEMRVAREEIFGPVLSVLRYSTVEEAIEIANNTDYGLAASVWTSDNDTALSVAARIRAGSVWINDAHQINAAVPFGGYKQSGLGRELGPDALAAFVETKAIHLDLSGRRDARPYDVLLSHADEETS
ncbi:acyl-CoA reductase-like NAD-dependent aldehyde dehydrogenase [Branchiibius hedensis]|uniref:Acyl-CoA reductase n=1 Tax=Branchiibius hedensis TaxID=672460 RepID=A0A2Y8ZK46_9MICO|nr:aldehyde dehydrogenase family protein [Branchiibius hedensis]PWJ23943.1 acyl-CoA reductase-like NAD-dependent aldehyde dehydrogenase [Branchiibius hedensis]SSA32761.1 Acyl-CoA reductase [Branchiibius hedensis]